MIIIINNYFVGKIYDIFWKIITGNYLQLSGKIFPPHITNSDTHTACGLATFNKLYGLRPLAQCLFCVPAHSAASERLFSQTSLIMRPTRNRLSKDRLKTGKKTELVVVQSFQ